MKASLNPLGLELIIAVVSVFLFPISASSQPITPASDGTGTRVNIEGTRHDIEGGSLSQDGHNLFHSFEKFGLSEGEIANFLSNPNIRNILGRVVGGDASIIHGLIQVTGGNSNLFLMNPAGMIFGPNASLNVPADFTATTATGIQFNENWFNAVGNNDYQALVGTPSGYAFAVSQPGVILNEGNLILEPGSHLTLLAGTVINTGKLSSPGGQITLASVEGENLVRISQEGQLLNLEISPMETASGEYPITPLSLPQLLTGGETTTEANTVIVSDNGQIILQKSNTVIADETGTMIVSGNLDVSDTNEGGNINIFASNSVVIIEESQLKTSGSNQSGKITLESFNGEIDTTGGSLDSSSLEGNGGDISLTAEGNITTNNIISYSFGEGRGGNITLSSNNGEINTTGSLDSSSSTGNGGNVSLTAEGNITTNNISSYSFSAGTSGGATGDINSNSFGTGTGGDITLSSNNGAINTKDGSLNSYSEVGDGGNISLTAEENITTSDISSNSFGAGMGGNITLSSNNGEIDTTGGSLYSSSSTGDGGNVRLTAENNIITGNITSGGGEQGGNITLNSNNGEINTTGGWLDSYSIKGDAENLNPSNGNAGNISLTAERNITTGDISSFSEAGRGGNIILESVRGEINTAGGQLDSYSSTGDAGNVNLTAEGNIITGDIRSYSFGVGTGGDITLSSNNGEINTKDGWLDSYSDGGDAGNVNLTAEGNIITGKISSYSGEETGGNIILESLRGEINTTGGQLESYSSRGVAGNIIINGNNGVTLGNNDTYVYAIRSYGLQQGGNIEITSSAGEINIGGKLDSYSEEGRGGNVTLNAAGQIETQGIYSDGVQQGGNISITSEGENNINILSPLQTFSEQGKAGNITLFSYGNINTQGIRSEGLQQGGHISISSSAGEINTSSPLNSFSQEGTAGNVTLNAAGHIEIQGIRSEGLQRGGDISITSESQNSINILGDLDTFSQQGEAGKITLFSAGNITTQNVRSYGQTESGDLIITSQGSISTGSVTTEATGGSSGNIIINGQEVVAGNVSSIGTVSAGKIQIEATDGSIRTLDLTSRSTEGNAGGIDLDATEDINTRDQTVDSAEGDSDINNNAGNDINIDGNQNATADNGNANINNTAGNDINIDGNQNANAGENANINNTAGNDINIDGNQDATADNGNANINNNAENEVNIDGNQTAIENGQPGTILNQAGDSNSANIEAIQPIFDNPEINRPAILAEDSNLPIPTPDPPENPQFNSENPGLRNSNNVDNRNNILLQRASKELRTEISDSPEGNKRDNNNESSGIGDSVSQVLNILNSSSVSPLAIASAEMVTNLEYHRNQEFSRYFSDDFAQTNLSTESVRNVLNDITQQTGTHSAVIYVTVQSNQLELVVFTADGKPLFHRVDVRREELLNVAQKFHINVANPRLSNQYMKSAQQLYDWLIRPIEPQLQAEGIDTILLSLDSGLRGIPIAALHDGEQFLIEKYSLSLIPSVSLMDTRYTSLKNSKVLAMGASEFLELNPLPGVPIELETVTQKLWQGQQFLNQEFTRENLINQRKKYPYEIIHLATHSNFAVENPADSYIQLWQNDKLRLDQLRTLGWQNPPVELLVLSSCKTAVGDEQAEIGFAGLAIQAGVKSALASLWYVNDMGALALMTEFYAHLDDVVIKADALRQAQLMMIQGQVKIQDSQWQGSESETSIVLPPQLNSMGNLDFSHPYYWSGFTMIGSPW